MTKISIHAPLTGSDHFDLFANADNVEFQSTLPLRGATNWLSLKSMSISISIHAPLTGSDHMRVV